MIEFFVLGLVSPVRAADPRLSDAVHSTLLDDLARTRETGPGGQRGSDSDSSATAWSSLAQSTPAVTVLEARRACGSCSTLMVVLPCCCSSWWGTRRFRDTTAGRSLIGALVGAQPCRQSACPGPPGPAELMQDLESSRACKAVTRREPGATDRTSRPARTPSREKQSARRGSPSERAVEAGTYWG